MVKTKILLVEDDKSLREIYGVRLYSEGYDIVSAGDGEEALAIAIKERPPLIISDVMMPKISGFDMLDILRSTTETKGIKVIMMTALSSEDQRARGEALGADRYLVKSQVGIEDVVRTVHEVLGDAPVSGGGNAFAAANAAPSAPTPAAGPTAPTPAPPAPLAAESTTTPLPMPTPQPTPTPTPQPLPAPGSLSATPTEAPTPDGLPLPTAPFSTNRPQSLGDRIINPIASSEPVKDFGALINAELGSNAAPAPATPVVSEPAPVAPAPIAPVAPTPVSTAPTPLTAVPTPVATPAPTTPPTMPAPTISTPAPAGTLPPTPPPTAPASGLSFEETPPATPPAGV